MQTIAQWLNVSVRDLRVALYQGNGLAKFGKFYVELAEGSVAVYDDDWNRLYAFWLARA